MSYIVTTTREQRVPGDSRVMQTISRCTVATFDMACTEARASADMWSFKASDQLQELTKSGGTIGPLPDGTTIEVTPTTNQDECPICHADGTHLSDKERASIKSTTGAPWWVDNCSH